MLRRTFFVSSVFPDTAKIGDTLAARFAGVLAASSTVAIPITMPLIIPIRLIPKRGMAVNSSLTTNLRIAHSIHVLTIPNTTPIGMAVLHQLRASSFTKRASCWRCYNFVGFKKFRINVVPVPSLLLTSTVPLCASTIIFARGRPRPIPCLSLENRLR